MRPVNAEARGAPVDLLTERHCVFVISPQPWDGFKVSKHHYAMALADIGHHVFFIDPPRGEGRPGHVEIAVTATPRLRAVRYRPWFPYALKFRSRPLFDRLMRIQAARLLRAVGRTPDVVWDFDNAFQFADLSVFKARKAIFHPVDSFRTGAGFKGADLVLSNASEFLECAGADARRAHLVPHGLGPDHVAYASRLLASPDEPNVERKRPGIGYVGNLDHPGIDWATISSLVERYPGADFTFYGPFDAARAPVKALRRAANCRFAGLQPSTTILAEAKSIDIWLLCYDRSLAAEGGINSHKLLEYLAMGNVVLANRIDAYLDCPLIVMPEERSNGAMTELLCALLADLPHWNSVEKRRDRLMFAIAHDYRRHLRDISEWLRTCPG